LAELTITKEKHEVLVRTAHYFLRERHIQNCPPRFDVVAIEKYAWPPTVRPPAQSGA
jgi:Holliday junction resolvase-like predicted endonuclease